MKIRDIITEAEKEDTLELPNIDVGDVVKVGKFKNRKATVTGFDKDSYNQPVLKTTKGDQKLFKPRISKLDEWQDDDYEEQLEFVDTPAALILNINNKPPLYLYRSVSQAELDNIKATGSIEPSKFYGRTHASAVPVGGDDAVVAILKIKYDPADDWKAKAASTGVYATTWESVSASKIVGKLTPAQVQATADSLQTVDDYYRKYQN
jgi:hypothetical protein